MKELDLFLPPWVGRPGSGPPHQVRPVHRHPGGASDLYRIRDVEQTVRSIKECEEVSDAG